MAAIDHFLNGMAVIMPGLDHQDDLYQYLLSLGVKWSSGLELGSVGYAMGDLGFQGFRSFGTHYGDEICYRLLADGLCYGSRSHYTLRNIPVLTFDEIEADIHIFHQVDVASLLSILNKGSV